MMAPLEGHDRGWLNARELGASGSELQTTVSTTAGSRQIVVADVEDFEPGQDVILTDCNPHWVQEQIWGPRGVVGWYKDLEGRAQIRGYDGSQGEWLVLILDVPAGQGSSFRWSDDIGRTWRDPAPMGPGWQPLRDGLEVRFHEHDWEAGYTVVFSGRSHLATTIETIDGTSMTLSDATPRATSQAILRHRDDDALQAVIDRAVRERKNVFVPVGHYRLEHGLSVKAAEGITIEGASGESTVLDISLGEGSCMTLEGGIEVNVRNFRIVGHSGFDARDQCGNIRVQGASYFWGFAANPCNAVHVRGTQRVLIENCHGRRMSAECFYSGGPSRSGAAEPEAYTKAITYLRCSVVDSGRNAFNNNDYAENTSVLHCRIQDVGGCTWEGASRFVEFSGNYVRNAGTVAMGNIGSRAEHLEELGSGQHVVADNTFESGVCYGGCAVRAAAGATQVVIRNNLFVNYNTSAVEMTCQTGSRHLPAANTTTIGNVFDLTCVEGEPLERHAILVSASDAIVADNQIYVRGACDPTATGICIREPAQNVIAHDNLVRGCGTGIRTERVQARVGEVIDAKTFLRGVTPRELPLVPRRSHRYRNWCIVWLRDDEPAGSSVIDASVIDSSVIDAFDPETLQFTLREPRETTTDELFEVFAPRGSNWHIHHNTVTGCLHPLVLDAYGGPTNVVADNMISRGEVDTVQAAVDLRGCFRLVGNHLTDFDEPQGVALALHADRAGRESAGPYLRNIFENCAIPVGDGGLAIWDAAKTGENLFLGCGQVPPGG